MWPVIAAPAASAGSTSVWLTLITPLAAMICYEYPMLLLVQDADMTAVVEFWVF